jgi:hypothetical protein
VRERAREREREREREGEKERERERGRERRWNKFMSHCKQQARTVKNRIPISNHTLTPSINLTLTLKIKITPNPII